MLFASSLLATGDPPGHVRYILVWKLETGAPTDLDQYGVNVHNAWRNRMEITFPEAALPALRLHPKLKNLQRVIPPEEAARWVAGEGEFVGVEQVPASSQVVRAATTPPRQGGSAPIQPMLPGGTWYSGEYLYDGAGNIINIGSAAYPNSDGKRNYFRYDSLNRLLQSSAHLPSVNKTEIYIYDPFGNLIRRKRTTADTTTETFDFATATSTNRLMVASYDSAGSMTVYEGHQYTHDAFGMMTKLQYSGTQNLYIYDANDERVGMYTPGTFFSPAWQFTVRGVDGKLLREYEVGPTLTGSWYWIQDFVYANGQLVGSEADPAEGGRKHFHLDHLGTPRRTTDLVGTTVAQHTYWPYGNEITPLSTVDPMRFTGHERDNLGGSGNHENYLDYLHARFHNPLPGRFLSVDPAGWDTKNPQSWNRYSYALNNPVNKIDPDGRNPVGALIGGFIGVSVESVRQVRSGEPVNNRKLAAALLGGGAAGAIGGFGATSLRGAIGFGALGNVTGGVIDRGVSGEKIFTSAVALDATTGIVGGAAGFKLGQAMVGASSTSGMLNELTWKAAAQRAEAAAGNLGLGADKETLRQAQEIIKGITAAGDVGGNVTAEVIKSERDEMKKALDEKRRRERDQLP